MARCASSIATPAQIRQAVAANATIIDLRGAAEFAEDPMVRGALHIEWDRDKETMADVPAADTIVLYCRTGGRAGKAKALLESRGFAGKILNAGGPMDPEPWAALQEATKK